MIEYIYSLAVVGGILQNYVVHKGWQGTVLKIVRAKSGDSTVYCMREEQKLKSFIEYWCFCGTQTAQLKLQSGNTTYLWRCIILRCLRQINILKITVSTMATARLNRNMIIFHHPSCYISHITLGSEHGQLYWNSSIH